MRHAKIASYRGANVTLISGQSSLKVPLGVKRIEIVSARQMFEACKVESGKNEIIIKSAAVADYRPKIVSDQKIKKSDGEMSLELEKTDDILKWLGENKKKDQFLCGFSMETQNMLENSRTKLEKKNLDMIVANNLKTAGAGFGSDTNVVTIITPSQSKELELMSKDEVAFNLLDEIKNILGE